MTEPSKLAGGSVLHEEYRWTSGVLFERHLGHLSKERARQNGCVAPTSPPSPPSRSVWLPGILANVPTRQRTFFIAFLSTFPTSLPFRYV